jgi:hypothetical protein
LFFRILRNLLAGWANCPAFHNFEAVITLRKHSNYIAELEHLRRKISKTPNPTTTEFNIPFNLKSIDIHALYEVYPNHMPQTIINLFAEVDMENTAFPIFEIAYESDVVMNHPKITKFNDLTLVLKEKLKDPNLNEKAARDEFKVAANSLASIISSDIKASFVRCLDINSKTFNKLNPHVDTLLFVCLYMYNKYWDAFKTDFNGSISDHAMPSLTHGSQPFEYRAINQTIFYSSTLYNYFKSSSTTKSLTLAATPMSTSTEDPIIIENFINSIINNSLPASTGRYGYLLEKLLQSTDVKHYSNESFLNELKKFTKLKLPNYNDVKRKVVKQYCLEIHKLFSYYLNLPTMSFSQKRCHIYHCILKCFTMDDFSDDKRGNLRSNKTTGRNTPANRLGELLRRKEF